jgi:hypothetical protein
MHSPYLSKSIKGKKPWGIDGIRLCCFKVTFKSKSKCKFEVAGSTPTFSITLKLENLKKTQNLL